jgi:hypothetical protein
VRRAAPFGFRRPPSPGSCATAASCTIGTP